MKKTSAPRADGPRLWPWFDLLGGLSVAAFVAVVVFDLRALGRPRQEISLHVAPEALAAGFREGVQWFGLYRGGQKVGFSRTERRRLQKGYRLKQQIYQRFGPAADRPPMEIEIDTELDEAFVLEQFRVKVDADRLSIEAYGTVQGQSLHIEAQGLGSLPAFDLPLPEPPVFDVSLGPLVVRRDLQPGDRFAMTSMDPISLTPQTGQLEFLERVDVEVLGETVEAIHLRQTVAGSMPLDLWVNELGEVLQQELPLQLLAVREAEAQATWEPTRR